MKLCRIHARFRQSVQVPSSPCVYIDYLEPCEITQGEKIHMCSGYNLCSIAVFSDLTNCTIFFFLSEIDQRIIFLNGEPPQVSGCTFMQIFYQFRVMDSQFLAKILSYSTVLDFLLLIMKK